MEAAARTCRAKLRATRDDAAGCHADLAFGLDFARRSGEPQVVLPTLADAALVAAMSGAEDAAARVAELCDELVRASAGAAGSYWTTDLALALALTDQPDRFAEIAADSPSRWLAASRSIADRRFAEAADMLAAIGARPEEALTRLLAGRALIARGRRAEGEVQLRRATGFWRGVRAAGLTATVDAMLAKTA